MIGAVSKLTPGTAGQRQFNLQAAASMGKGLRVFRSSLHQTGLWIEK